MAKKFKLITLAVTLAAVICLFAHAYIKTPLTLSLLITFMTTAYHFIMRLLVGGVINFIFNNRVNYNARWFKPRSFEQKLYKALKVKRWKGKMGTYDPDCFDAKLHSWHEIAQAMCQAEMVHEVIILLSFLPIFAAIPFGSPEVFIITSILAACYDSMYVILQRYNRPRVIALCRRQAAHTNKQ